MQGPIINLLYSDDILHISGRKNPDIKNVGNGINFSKMSFFTSYKGCLFMFIFSF